GLIPVLSDVLGSVSMSALLVPNKYSLFAGIGGLTASASLKIVDSLLKPKFNMSKNEDRENFISLVCSFYEIKTEVEERKFLHIATSKDKQNYLTAHDFAISIDSKIKKLQIEKEAILKELQTLEEDFLLTNLGQEKILFTHNAHKFESFLSSHGDETSWTFRSQLPDVLIEISGLLQNIEFDENRYQSFTDIGADKNKFLDSASLLSDVQVRLYDDQQLAQIFLQPLLRIDEILQAELSRYDEQLQARIVEDELSFAELKTDIEKIFDEKIELLTQSFSKINDYIKKIKVKIDKKNFVADDQGTHIDHLIVKFIKSIEGQFFGHLGWQFYEYLRNGAARELKDFYKYYAKFANKYGLRSNRSIVDEAQRRVACATASDIIVRINNSRSLVNMGADYVFSNRDFFHENVSKIDVHFKVIPTGASIQRQFLTQARSLIKAQEFVASGEKLNFPRVLNNKNVFRHPLLGDLMVGQLLADNQLEKLYEFKSINQCDRW
ncbi:MAG: hypothetical protein KC505_03160, partial [Myxococcales bacterium]|nr:hypothetical protein [Myxococcales bacterium]